MMYKADQSAFAVQFSPFIPGKLAVATSQNFGVVGNGRLSVIQATQAGLDHVVSFDTVDGASHARMPRRAS
jgi:peroxin-7